MNLALALVDDSIHGCQTKVRSLANFLGSKERLKDAGAGFFTHALAGIRDGQ